MPRELAVADVDVDSAYRELECCWCTEDVPHSGNVTGLYVAHQCMEGWVCEGHHKFFVNVYYPATAKHMFGTIRCADCEREFHRLSDFFWVVPL